MNKLKHYFPNYILTILLVFFTTGLSLTILLSGSILNPDFYIDSADKNNIYQKSIDYAQAYFDKNYAVSSIPSEVYMDAIDKKVVKQAVDGKINAFFDYVSGKTNKIEKSEIDFTILEKNISDFFDEFAKENNVEINDLFKQQLNKTLNSAKNEVNLFTNVYMLDYLEKAGIASKLRTVDRVSTIALWGMVGGMAVCIILMVLLNRKDIKSILYWIGTAGLCASVIGLIPCIIIKQSDYFSRLIMRTDYVYYAVTGLLGDIVSTFLKHQIIILIASVVIMAVFAITSKLSRQKEKS